MAPYPRRMEVFLVLVLFCAAGVFAILWGIERSAKQRLEHALALTDHNARQALGARDSHISQMQSGAASADAGSRKSAETLSRAAAELRERQAWGEALEKEVAALRKSLATVESSERRVTTLLNGTREDAARVSARAAEDLRKAADGLRAAREYSEGLEREKREIESRVKESQRALTGGEKAARTEVTRAAAHVVAIATRYIEDTLKWCVSRITPNNLETTRAKFEKVLAFCAKHDFALDETDAKAADAEIVAAFKDAVRKDLARQEQARIKEQMREEQRLDRDLKTAQDQAKREEAIIQDALTKALKKNDDEHSAEVQGLQAQLLALQEKKRALSMAQQTRAGHIYVISNIGSFGHETFKVGMTRRLEPQDRVDELGDASVPFPFDVHMMISCVDAPKLENTLHRELHHRRANKVNLRKEFFRATIDEIVAIVEKAHGKVDYVAAPEALQFNETRAIEERGSFDPHYAAPDIEEQITEV